MYTREQEIMGMVPMKWPGLRRVSEGASVVIYQNVPAVVLAGLIGIKTEE